MYQNVPAEQLFPVKVPLFFLGTHNILGTTLLFHLHSDAHQRAEQLKVVDMFLATMASRT